MKATAFDLLHPAVALVYFVFLLVASMAAMQPVYLAASFCAALVYSMVLRGVRRTVRTLAWQMPLLALIALVNFALSLTGSTVLISIGSHAFYLESLVYGICMGLMLVTVMLTFSNASHVLTSDKIMALLGNVLPTVGLMTCMTMRLVPQLVRQGGDIGHVRRACTAALEPRNSASPSVNQARSKEISCTDENDAHAHHGLISRVRMWAREVSVLMGWSMENSIETSDSMRSRGWGASARRTTYTRYRFRVYDGIILCLLLVLALVCVISIVFACSHFQFYPQLDGFAPWWIYLPYVLYVALPLIAEMRERVRWSI